jgi:hypothetical protein
MAARMAVIATTTSSSTRVKPAIADKSEELLGWRDIDPSNRSSQ